MYLVTIAYFQIQKPTMKVVLKDLFTSLMIESCAFLKGRSEESEIHAIRVSAGIMQELSLK